MTDTPVPGLTGKIIGQTEKATHALFDVLLAETHTDFHHWVVLQLVAAESTIEPPRLVTQMADGLKITPAAACHTLDDAAARGLVTASDHAVTLTPAGAARYERIAAIVAELTSRLYGDLPPGDLETTRRVLTVVTQRANAELAAR